MGSGNCLVVFHNLFSPFQSLFRLPKISLKFRCTPALKIMKVSVNVYLLGVKKKIKKRPQNRMLVLLRFFFQNVRQAAPFFLYGSHFPHLPRDLDLMVVQSSMTHTSHLYHRRPKLTIRGIDQILMARCCVTQWTVENFSAPQGIVWNLK